MSSIGNGEWSAYIAGRGGSPIKMEIAWSSISVSKVLNGSGSANLNIPTVAASGAACCEVVAKSEPWRDEVVLYRDDELAFAGPLQTVGGSDSPNCFAPDLFQWTKVRFIEQDMHFDADVADIFHGVFDAAMAEDTSPNIEISTRQTGVLATRDYLGADLHEAQGALTELAKTGLDFTMIGRKLVAGGLEIFLQNPTLILHDDGVQSAEPIKDGSNFANDVAVLCATLTTSDTPISGRAILGESVYGKVQRVYTELLIRDKVSADANASARVHAMQPIPQRVHVTLSPNAPFGYHDLLPGKRIDVRLERAGGCMEIMETMRVVQVTTEVSNSDSGRSETVSADLIPLGLGDDE